jgi:hypothetical protein
VKQQTLLTLHQMTRSLTYKGVDGNALGENALADAKSVKNEAAIFMVTWLLSLLGRRRGNGRLVGNTK